MVIIHLSDPFFKHFYVHFLARGLPAALFFAGFLGVAGADEAVFPTSRAWVETPGGARHSFRVEEAVTPDQRLRGLMFRRSLPEDAGMLFDFGRSRPVAMWMENTFVALDVLFIDTRGRITHIVRNTAPLSRALIPSRGPVRYVLELPAGTVERFGIEVGGHVRHRLIRP